MGTRQKRKLSTKGESLYALLDLVKPCSPDDIKKSYRRLALRYHPDKNPNDPEANQQFINIKRAYLILNDPMKRRVYDRFGSMGIDSCEKFPNDVIDPYQLIGNRCYGVIFLCCIVFTGCCFGCCCCCNFCCNFCCGLCKPKDPNYDFGQFENDNMSDIGEEPGNAPSYPGTTAVTQQPQE